MYALPRLSKTMSGCRKMIRLYRWPARFSWWSMCSTPSRALRSSSVILRSTLVHTTFCQNSLPRGSTELYQYASVVDLG